MKLSEFLADETHYFITPDGKIIEAEGGHVDYILDNINFKLFFLYTTEGDRQAVKEADYDYAEVEYVAEDVTKRLLEGGWILIYHHHSGELMDVALTGQTTYRLFDKILRSSKIFDSVKDMTIHDYKINFYRNINKDNILDKGLLKAVTIAKRINESLEIPNFQRMSRKRMIAWVNENLEMIGQGVSKNVYLLPDDKVLKIARKTGEGFYGAGQIGAEIRVSKFIDPRIISKVFDYDKKHFYWLISEWAGNINDDDFKEYYGIPMYSFGSVLKRIYKGKKIPDAWHEEWWVKAFIEFYKKFPWMISAIDLGLKQFGKTKDGRIVFVDFGYTRKMYKRYRGGHSNLF